MRRHDASGFRVWRVAGSRRLGIILLVIATAIGVTGVPATAQESATLTARLTDGNAYGNGWPAGATVDVSVNGATAGSEIVQSNGFVFIVPTVAFTAGDTLTITDGTTTKALVVSALKLEVIDPESEVVAGSAPAGETVIAELHDGTEFCRPELVVDASGSWIFDFSEPDSLGRSCDLGYEDMVTVYVVDGDGDRSEWSARHPMISVNLAGWVQGQWWYQSTDVDISRGGTVVGANVDVIDGRFSVGIGAPLAPGEMVTVTDGIHTKTVTVIDIDARPYDPDTMTIAGTAPRGTQVHATIADRGGLCTAQATADAQDEWVANFAGVVPDFGTCDLASFTRVRVYVVDEDADESSLDVGFPRITAQRFDGNIYGSEWAASTGVDLSINGVPAGSGTTDVRGFVFIQPAFYYAPGDTIELTDGTITKSLIVSAVDAETIDPPTDTVSGTATPGETISANLLTSTAFCRHEITVVSDGNWQIDFSEPDVNGRSCDLGYQDGVDVWVTDEDGDRTLLWVKTPIIGVDRTFGTVSGSWWFNGDPVDIEYAGSMVATGVAVSNGFFQLSLGLPVTSGESVVVSDGAITKSVTIVDITAGFYDPATQSVAGTAPAGQELSVNISTQFGGSCTVETSADGAGTWAADFTGAIPERGSCDFDETASVRVFVVDEDADEMQVTATVPRIAAISGTRVGESIIAGNYWTPDQLVEIHVNGVRVAEIPADEYMTFDTGTSPIEPGDEVVASDGTTTKTLIVADLSLADVDVTTDIVAGHGPPGEEIDVSYFEAPGRFCRRSVAVTSDGSWAVDFSTAEGSDPVCDLGASAQAEVTHFDVDADRTTDVLEPSKEPDAVDDFYTTPENTTLEVSEPGVLANDTEPNADGLSVFEHDAISAAGGTVTMPANGSFVYEPPEGFSGEDSFEYTATDGTRGDSATVTVNVEATPPPSGVASPAPAQPKTSCPDITDPGPFEDLEGLPDKAKTAINCLHAYGITQGTAATEFSPAAPVPRWQMALFLARHSETLGIESGSGGDAAFVDIAGLDAEARQAINALAELGITEGTSEYVFSPHDTVPRWQMALFLARLLHALGVEVDNSPSTPFGDIEGLGPDTERAIGQLADLGVTTGTTWTTFEPHAIVTRWQMALFLVRVLELGEVNSP